MTCSRISAIPMQEKVRWTFAAPRTECGGSIEEATGVEQPDGMLSEIMEELDKKEETMEQAEESLEDLQESMDTMEELQEMEDSSGKMLPPDGQAVVTDQDEAARIYKRIDVIV